MDTGYPALIPELVHNHNPVKPSTIASPANSDIPQDTVTHVDPASSPPTTEKVP